MRSSPTELKIAPLQADELAATPKPKSGVLLNCFIAVLIIAVIFLEYRGFRGYFKQWLEPYHVVNFDQMAIFWGAYRAFFSLAQSGHLPADYFEGLCAAKGALVPQLALSSVLLFGPHRFSINLINFAFFVTAQLAVFFTASRLYCRSTALLAVGLFLLPGTHFFQFGGLDDARIDYAGMAVMGLCFLASLNWLLHGGRVRLSLLAASLATLTFTRFVYMFYWIGGLPLAILPILAINEKKASKLSVSRLIQAWLVTLICCTVQLAFCWQGFFGKYVQLKLTSQDSIRWLEFGVHNTTERLLYYPNSFWIHFHEMFYLSMAVVASTVAFKLAGLKSGSPSPDDGRCELLSWVTLTATLASAYVILTMYSPSPIVIAAFSVPVAITLAGTCSRLLKEYTPIRLQSAICAVAFAYALCSFLVQLKQPIYPPHADVDSSRSLSCLMDKVVTEVKGKSGGITLGWVVFHEALHGPAFVIKWAETQQTSIPRVRHKHMPAFPPLPQTEFLKLLADSDFAIVPVAMPAPPMGWFEYPGLTRLRTELAGLQPTLRNEFKLVYRADGVYAGHPNRWSIGLYKRISGTITPFAPGSDIEGLSELDPQWRKYDSGAK